MFWRKRPFFLFPWRESSNIMYIFENFLWLLPFNTWWTVSKWFWTFVGIIRLQVPRLDLRHRLTALRGGVCRPAPWRHRPIAFLCYVLSVSALRPLANRVRAALIGREVNLEKGNDVIVSDPVFLLSDFLYFLSPVSFCCQCSFLWWGPYWFIICIALVCYVFTRLTLQT